MIQCLRLLLEEMTEDLDPSLVNTAAKLRELKPDEETSQLKLWEYRVNIQALWEDPAIQVRLQTYRIKIRSLKKISQNPVRERTNTWLPIYHRHLDS